MPLGPLLPLVARQGEQFIQRAALFERAGALLIVELKKDGILR